VPDGHSRDRTGHDAEHWDAKSKSLIQKTPVHMNGKSRANGFAGLKKKNHRQGARTGRKSDRDVVTINLEGKINRTKYKKKQRRLCEHGLTCLR